MYFSNTKLLSQEKFLQYFKWFEIQTLKPPNVCRNVIKLHALQNIRNEQKYSFKQEL